MTASIIYEGNSQLYNIKKDHDLVPLFHDVLGFIFRPSENRIFCSYAGDGGSMNKVCDPPGQSEQCLPGCWDAGPEWCGVSQVDCNGPFPAEQLDEMMRRHSSPTARLRYNEVIVDADWFIQQLPHSVEAFVGDRTAHAAFLSAFDLKPADCPLVQLVESRGDSGGDLSIHLLSQ